jgi:hypothetical protein
MGFARKHLSADGLIDAVQQVVSEMHLPPIKVNTKYSWEDCIMSGLAIFMLKSPSLLQFDIDSKNHTSVVYKNLTNLFGVKEVPSDTCLRKRLDEIPAHNLRIAFKKIFALMQRGGLLEQYRYLDNYYILSIDGTGQYSSANINCDNCCEKHHHNGQVTYYHHMLGAAIVHPEHKTVIPLAPEPIIKHDGKTKNDCERNASKRLLQQLRIEHPHLKIIIVEDSLSSNHPHLALLDQLHMEYIIGVKAGDHEYLFDSIKHAKPTIFTYLDDKKIKHEFSCYYSMPINYEHYDYTVNILMYTETTSKGKVTNWSWVTKLPLTEENVFKIMRAARARWRIENETFNTLKNQGYNFEHNYGHGYKNLCSVMTMLMILAFLIDQVQQACCGIYQQARHKSGGTLRVFFENIRAFFRRFVWQNFQQLLEFIGDIINAPPPQLDVC